MIEVSLIILLLVIFIIFYLVNDQKEGFWGWRRSPRYCPNCGDHGPSSCMNCVNCGMSVSTTGHAKCLPGGPRGPLFSSNTIHWRYGGGNYPYYRRPHRYHWWHFW